MKRFLTCLVLQLAIVVAAAAQTLQRGDIILLRGNSGRYVSAGDGGVLNMSPNTAAWEQWEYRPADGGGASIVSSRGTAWIKQPGFGFHGPAMLADAAFFVRKLEQYDDFGIRRWRMVRGEAPVASGDQVAITDTRGWIVNEAGDTVAINSVQSAPAVPDIQRWTMTIVRTPAGGRLPLQKGIPSDGYHFLKNPQGNYLQHGRIGIKPVHALHLRERPVSAPRVAVENQSSQWDRAMKFGDRVWVHWPKANVLKIEFGKPSVAPLYLDKAFLWTVVDPNGRQPSGSRVALGEKFCLRYSDDSKLSADPATPYLKLSPNCSDWEWWTFESAL